MGGNREVSARDRIRQDAKEKNKGKLMFPAFHMWVSYLLAMFEKDRGKIPDNIGNKMLIGINMYCTKSYMTSIIQITSLSLKTPVTLLEVLNQELRKEGCEALLDMTIKNQKFDVNLEDSGMSSRIRMWKSAANAPMLSKEAKEVSARCLYTVDLVERGHKLKQSREFLKISAKNGTQLRRAEKTIMRKLNELQIGYIPISGNVKGVLKYISIIADRRDDSVKDIKAIINTNLTLAQHLPNNNSVNVFSDNSCYMGVNKQNNQPYNIDFKTLTKARNIYVTSPAGVGKTVIALNLAQSFVESGNAVCTTDLKGNEFTNFIKATGGYKVSLRLNSTEYFNSWKMHKEDATDLTADMYFYERFNFSIKQMVILSGLTKSDHIRLAEQLFDEFLRGIYIKHGVLSSNRNTWKFTDSLTPYVIYDYLVEYMTPSVIRRYSEISQKVLQALKITMYRNGSKSYIFRNEFDYATVFQAPTLSFDFGILEDSRFDQHDDVIFKLKFEYMQQLKGRFVSYKYSHGLETLVIDEESQIAADVVLKAYVEDFTLRRSQRQTTLLLGNSVNALVDNVISKPLIENTTAILIGRQESDENIDLLVSKFGLEEKREVLNSMRYEKDMDNSFLFINKMERDALSPVLQVQLEKGKRYKMYTPVKEETALAR